VQYLAQGLVARGHEVLVLSKGAKWWTVRELVSGVQVVRMGSPPGYTPNVYDHISLSRQVMTRLLRPIKPQRGRFYVGEIAKFKPDIVHSNAGADVQDLWTGVENLGIPSVHTLRNPSLLCDRRMFVEGKSCSGQCDSCRSRTRKRRNASSVLSGVVGISSHILQEHLTNGYFHTVKLRRVIPNSYDPKAVTYVPRKSGELLRLGYLGRLHETKGIEELVVAMKALTGRAKLLVAGTGNPHFVRHLEDIAGDNVEFLGFVAPEEVFGRVDALVVPSLWNEPFGRVYAESLVHGVPVLGSVHGAGRELVSEGQTGWLCDPSEAASLDSALARCIHALSIAETQAEMRALCIESGKRFAPDAVAAAYEEVYLAAIDVHARRGQAAERRVGSPLPVVREARSAP